MRDRLLQWLAKIVWRFPIVILVIALGLAAVSALYASKRLTLNANTDDLIKQDRPFMADYRQFLTEFGDLEYIYVVVENRGDPQRAEEVVDRLTQRLLALPDVAEVHSAVDVNEQLRIATRAMSDDELHGLATASGAFPAMMSGDVARVLDESKSLLKTLIRSGKSMAPEMQERLGGAAVFMLNAIASAKDDSPSAKELAFLLGEIQKKEYFKTESGHFYFISVRSEKDYRTLSVIQKPLEEIRNVIDETRAEFASRSEYHGITIGLTGKPVLQADEMATTDADMTRSALIAVAACSILFMLAFGSVWRPLMAVAAFACGAAWTYGYATLAVGQLNLLSIVFILILVGIGLDYGVHVISRYREHRAHEDVRTSVAAAIVTAGRGNITGSLASATVFFMALFTTFQGLRELGVIAGGGLLLCMIAMTIVLPALLVLAYRWGSRAHVGVTTEAPHPEDEGPGVLRAILRRPGIVIIVTILISAGFAFAIPRLRFEYNLLKLQAEGLESVQWERRIMDDSVSNTWFGVAVTDSLEQAHEYVERAHQQPHIGEVHSVFDVIKMPTPQREQDRARLHEPLPETAIASTQSDQAAQTASGATWTEADLNQAIASLDLIAIGAALQAPEEAKKLRQISADLKDLSKSIETHHRDMPLLPDPVKQKIEHNIKLIGNALRAMLEGDELDLREALPDGVRRQFMSPRNRFAVMMHPNENVWDLEPMRLYVTDMRAVDPHVTGAPVAQYESIGDMMHSFRLMSLLALGVIVVIVTVDFGHWREILLALLPLALGTIWTSEFMGLLDIPFNLANFFSVPILIGLSVNGSVYVLHRHREGGATRFTLGATRRAVIVTTLNTMIGFGCLMLAHHRGLRSLGQVMVIGTASYLFATLIVLPAVLSWLEIAREKRANA